MCLHIKLTFQWYVFRQQPQRQLVRGLVKKLIYSVTRVIFSHVLWLVVFSALVLFSRYISLKRQTDTNMATQASLREWFKRLEAAYKCPLNAHLRLRPICWPHHCFLTCVGYRDWLRCYRTPCQTVIYAFVLVSSHTFFLNKTKGKERNYL